MNAISLKQRLLLALLTLAWTGPALAQGSARGAAGARVPAAETAAASTDRQPPGVSTDRQPPGVSTDRLGAARQPRAGSVSVPGIGDLPAGKTLTIVFRASVDAGPFAAGKNDLSNQGTFTGGNIPATPTDDPGTGAVGDPTLTPLDAAPDLQLAVSDGGASTVPGGTVAYTLSFANAGSQGASGVTLASVVPANTTFNPGASTAGWACVPNNNAGSACTLLVGGLNGGGASGSATFAVTVVNPVAAGVTQIAANATIADDNGNGPDPTPGNNSAGDTTPLTAQPDLALTKSDGGATVTPGGTVAYTLTYSNVGNQGATGLVLTETVPANATFNPGASTAGWACVPNNNAGSTCTLTIGALNGGGASGTATFAVDVPTPVPAGVTQISNTASAADDGANGPDPNAGNNTGSDTTPINAAPDLSLTKSDGGATVVPGGTVAYTLDYANTGTRGATGVVLTETVPANTAFNPGASTAGWACVPNNNAGSTCTLAIGAVPANGAGSSGSVTFAVTVASPVASGVTQISNSASAADDGANGTDPTPANNTGADTTPVNAAPDFTLTKSDGGATVAPGGTVAYTLGYANAGNQNAVGVTLTETVPASTTFNPGASTAGWACVPNNNAGSTCTLAIGALNGGGASGSATFAVTVVNPAPSGLTQISNTASAADDGSNGPDPTPGNNSGSDTTPVNAAPDLTLTKSDGGATVAPGGTVAYTLSYANPGNQNATGVTLTETVPASTTFNPGASTAGWTCVPNNNAGSTCTLAIGALNGGGASGTATFAVTVVNPAPAGLDQISNTAGAADDGTNGPDPTPGNNAGSDTTPVNAAPDLALTKDDGGVSVNTGGTVAYTLGYSNIGSQGATGVFLNETVPANTTFNPGASTAGWTCAPNNNAGSLCTLNIGALPAAGPSSSGTATFAVTVNSTVPSGVTQISNTAGVFDDITNGADTNPGNNNASDTTPVVAVPDLTISVTDGRIAVHAGQVLTYVITYRNVGAQDATGVTLSDVVPVGGTFFDPAGTSGWSCAHGAPPATNCTFTVPGTVAAGGAPQTVDFRVKVDNPIALGTTILNNEVSITDDGSNGPDGNPGNNSALDTNTIVTPKGDMNRPASREVRATNIARTDLIFQNQDSNRIVIWFMDYASGVNQQGGANFTTPLAPAAGYRVVGADDFNDDGLTDLVFRNDASGTPLVWLMDGVLQAGVPSLPPALDPGTAWRLEATGDFDGDGRADLLWRNTVTGAVEVSDGLTGNPRTPLGNAPLVPDPWRIAGSGQFNLGSDSNADLLVVNTATRALEVWLLNGSRQLLGPPVATSPALVPAGWNVAAVGDYNVDNQADIVLQNPLSGSLVTWFMNGTVRVSGGFTSPAMPTASNWRVVGPR